MVGAYGDCVVLAEPAWSEMCLSAGSARGVSCRRIHCIFLVGVGRVEWLGGLSSVWLVAFKTPWRPVWPVS